MESENCLVITTREESLIKTYVRSCSECDWPLYSFPIVSVVVVCEYCIDRVEYVKCLE